MSIEQFKELFIVKHKFVKPVPFEKRKGMTSEQKKNEKQSSEAINRLGLIYEDAEEVKKQDLRVEGMSE